MSRGIGKLQRALLTALEPRPGDDNPYVCLAEYDLPPAKYEAARRALLSLERRGLIAEVCLWRIALGQKSKRYALPAVADAMDWRIAHICEHIAGESSNLPDTPTLIAAESVVPGESPTLIGGAA